MINQRSENMSDRNDFATFFAGLIVGGLVGSSVALLLAPQSGEETRTFIRDKSIELKDRAVEYGADARARAEQALEDARARADAAIEDVRLRTDDLTRMAQRQIAGEKPPAAEPPAAEPPLAE
jgi:gas vesicle protein